ncbi:MAG: redoxin family protein [Mucilaginibacter sp.]
MRKFLFFTVLLSLAHVAIAQKSASNSQSVIIEGKITGLKTDKLSIGYRVEDGYVFDECDVDKEGNFYLKSDKFTKPVTVDFSDRKSVLSNIYVAPSYHLIITGDASSVKTFNLTKKVSGYGSAANKFTFKRDSAFIANQPGKYWPDLNRQELIAYINRRKKIEDSLEKIVFKAKAFHDKYYHRFKEISLLDEKFENLYFLVNHAYDEKNFTAQQSDEFIRNNFEPEANKINYNPSADFLPKSAKPGILNNLFNDEYLQSNSYRTLIMSDYVAYLWKQQYRRDSSKVDMKHYNIDAIKIISQDYKGKVKELALYNTLQRSINYCRSYEELFDYEKAFPKYIDQLQDTGRRTKVYAAMKNKERDLVKIAIGQPAPVFTAQDSLGRKISLDSFKGKIVYIDLWASWCGRCRQETPYLKNIYEK